MKATAILAALLSALTLVPPCAAGVRPEGTNCSLSEPPADSGEETSHGVLLRVYPRAKDIDRNYSGCQLLMAQEKGKWIVVSYTEVIEGDPVRVWSEYELDPTRLTCRYKAGKLVAGDERSCPAPDFLLVRSLAPGCVAAIGEQVKRRGIGAPWPSGCNYD